MLALKTHVTVHEEESLQTLSPLMHPIPTALAWLCYITLYSGNWNMQDGRVYDGWHYAAGLAKDLGFKS